MDQRASEYRIFFHTDGANFKVTVTHLTKLNFDHHSQKRRPEFWNRARLRRFNEILCLPSKQLHPQIGQKP